MNSRQNQIITYYLHRLFNWGAEFLYDEKFLATVADYLKSVYDCDVDTVINKNFIARDLEIIRKCRQLVNGEIEYVTRSGVRQKIQITDITDYDFDKSLSFIADAFHIDKEYRPLLQCLVYFARYKELRNWLGPLECGDDFSVFYQDQAEFLNLLSDVPVRDIEWLLSANGLLFARGILCDYSDGVYFCPGFENLLSQEFKTKEQVFDAMI